MSGIFYNIFELWLTMGNWNSMKQICQYEGTTVLYSSSIMTPCWELPSTFYSCENIQVGEDKPGYTSLSSSPISAFLSFLCPAHMAIKIKTLSE